MSEGLPFRRPQNPVFKPARKMTQRDLRVVGKWNGWLLVQLASIHSSGAWGQPKPRNMLDIALNIMCALDAGARAAVLPSGPLHERLVRMPPLPAVWPDDYPFGLAWHFLEHLQDLATAHQGGDADCPPPLE
jgi:hypothetical protein